MRNTNKKNHTQYCPIYLWMARQLLNRTISKIANECESLVWHVAFNKLQTLVGYNYSDCIHQAYLFHAIHLRHIGNN